MHAFGIIHFERLHEAVDAIVGNLRAILGRQILTDTLAAQTLFDAGLNRFPVGFAVASTPRFPGLRNGTLWALYITTYR